MMNKLWICHCFWKYRWRKKFSDTYNNEAIGVSTSAFFLFGVAPPGSPLSFNVERHGCRSATKDFRLFARMLFNIEDGGQGGATSMKRQSSTRNFQGKGHTKICESVRGFLPSTIAKKMETHYWAKGDGGKRNVKTVAIFCPGTIPPTGGRDHLKDTRV